MNTADLKEFFDRVASDWDTMRIAYQGIADDVGTAANQRARSSRSLMS